MPRWSALLVASLALAVAGCTAPAADQDNSESFAANGCGSERWDVKTGTDAAASQVNLTAQDTTIAALGAISAPSGNALHSPRFTTAGSPELQAWRLRDVTLVEYKLESDSDYHLVLSSGGHTMIAEIPSPNCVAGGGWAAQIAAARQAMDQKFTVTPSFQTANITVTVTGVGFFDLPHGQTGVAPNAIELHSVLDVCFTPGCGGGGTAPDFGLSATPGAVSTAAGGSSSASVSLTPQNGFVGNAALSASGLPAGATASFSPASVSASGSSTLALNAGSAAAGTYPVTITGTSGSLSHAVQMSWTILPAATPDFTLAASPNAVSSKNGAVATSTITLTALNGFAGTASLSAAGLPGGASASFSPASAKVGTPATLTLSPGKASSGTYPITVVGAAGALSHAASLSWTIASSTTGDTTPPSVTITSPAPGAKVVGTVSFAASASDDVAVAQVELFVDGSLLATLTSAPYSTTLDSTKLADGAHELVAKAVDTSSNVGSSSAVPINVRNSTGGGGGGTQELVKNGGFEGSLSSWTLGGAKWPIDSTAHPHGGRYSMRLGATTWYEPDGDSYGYQFVQIPADATQATLTFWWYGLSHDTVDYDWQEAAVLDVNGNTLVPIFFQADDSRTWTPASVDLLPYAGQTVVLWFNCHGDGAGDTTTLWIDDVSLKATSGGGTGDVTPPTVALTSPAAGATLSGTVALGATASDDVGVARVEFYLDGARISAASAAPYAASWDTTTAAEGAHELAAQAFDAVGNVGASAIVRVTVHNGAGGDTTPPTVALTAPASGATLSGTAQLSASASDNVGVTRVEFWVDQALLATSTTSPYGASWNTTAASNGSHQLSAKAYDAAGNVGTSSAITVNVSNSTGDHTPPTVSITAPSAGSTVSGSATFSASASDNVGVTRVELYVDGALLTTLSAAPYSTSWDTTSASNAAHQLSAKAYDAAGNVGTSTAVSVTVHNVVQTGGLQNVFVILMENHNLSQIKGSSSAPYLNNTLFPQGALATQYFNPPGNHPSLPNYLWLEAGTNFGVADDNPPSSHPQSTSQHLVALLQAKGLGWKSYQEGITGTSCPVTASGLYAPKHNPMVYFTDVTSSSANCVAHVRPYSELATDIARNTVPRYSFITPDLCDDMHNSTGCSSTNAIANGDAWLSREVPKILGSAAYQNGGALFIVFDESEGGDVPIMMLALSAKAKPGYTNSIAYSHSSLLRTVQEIFGVTPLLGDAANATDLSDLFTSFP